MVQDKHQHNIHLYIHASITIYYSFHPLMRYTCIIKLFNSPTANFPVNRPGAIKVKKKMELLRCFYIYTSIYKEYTVISIDLNAQSSILSSPRFTGSISTTYTFPPTSPGRPDSRNHSSKLFNNLSKGWSLIGILFPTPLHEISPPWRQFRWR